MGLIPPTHTHFYFRGIMETNVAGTLKRKRSVCHHIQHMVLREVVIRIKRWIFRPRGLNKYQSSLIGISNVIGQGVKSNDLVVLVIN